MSQTRYHAERAFESYLRARRIPYVAVNEARRALLPLEAASPADDRLKSFDFVVYGRDRNLLVEVKGRRLAANARAGIPARHQRPGGLAPARSGGGRGAGPRLECWSTERDVADLLRWQSLFGEGFEAAFVFVYACVTQPADGVFDEVFPFEGAWYALRAIGAETYARQMKVRSPRWGTVDLPARVFAHESRAFGPGFMGLEDEPVKVDLGQERGQPGPLWCGVPA
ncbi:MAG: HYExAFE family protein [Phycisphaerales bacterium]